MNPLVKQNTFELLNSLKNKSSSKLIETDLEESFRVPKEEKVEKFLSPVKLDDPQRIRRTANRKGLSNIAYFHIDHLISYLNLKEILTLLKLNRNFSLAVRRQPFWQSFLHIRNELRLGTNNPPSKQNKDNPNKMNRLAPVKTPRNIYMSRDASSVDYNKYTLGDYLKNDGKIFQTWIRSYKISKQDAMLIFPGLILKQFTRLYGDHPDTISPARLKSLMNTANANTKKIFLILKSFEMNTVFEYLSAALISYPRFSKIDFSFNSIEPRSMRKFSKSLHYNCSMGGLSILNLSNNKINDAGVKIILQGLGKKNQIKFLDFSGNEIGSIGAKGLEEYILNPNTILETLNLQNNLLGSIGAKHIANGLMKNTTIRAINLSFNGICAEGSKHFTDVFLFNNKLVTFYYGGNYIFAEGVSYLIKGLIKNKSISYLFLEWNNIYDEGMEYIAELISNNPSIYTVDLKNNKITDEGVETLFKAIAWRTRLVNLDLSSNLITDAGMKTVCDVMKQNKSIGGISFENIKLSAISCQYISEMLRKNKTLKNLNLTNCDIGENAIFLFSALKENQRLTVLNLGNNSIGGRDLTLVKEIESTLKTNLFLSDLNLDKNNLNDMEIETICQGLNENKSVHMFSAKENLCTKFIVPVVESIFKINKHIIEFDLTGNRIEREFLVRISDAGRFSRRLYLLKSGMKKTVEFAIRTVEEKKK